MIWSLLYLFGVFLCSSRCISLATRRLEFSACTPNPNGRWVCRRARNLVIQLGEQERPFRRLIRARDSTFSRAFDEVFRSEGIE